MPTVKDPTPNSCGCGCGTKVARSYKQGHDAKHKSDLIKRANGNDPEVAATAEKILAMRDWTKFLDKSREPKAERQEKERQEADHAKAVDTVARLNTMKVVARALKDCGDKDTQVTVYNYQELAASLGLLESV